MINILSISLSMIDKCYISGVGTRAVAQRTLTRFLATLLRGWCWWSTGADHTRDGAIGYLAGSQSEDRRPEPHSRQRTDHLPRHIPIRSHRLLLDLSVLFGLVNGGRFQAHLFLSFEQPAPTPRTRKLQLNWLHLRLLSL